jgi:hypothetical protein
LKTARTYRLAGITVKAELPADWVESLDAAGCPTFRLKRLDGATGPGLEVVRAEGADHQVRLQHAMEQTFGADLVAASRTPRDKGRMWVVHTRADGAVHARMFLVAAAAGTVVSAYVVLPAASAARLAEIQVVFNTVRLA